MNKVGEKTYIRRSTRLPGFDYATPGAYFVTICTQDRLPLFGSIAEGTMALSRFGEIVLAVWLQQEKFHPELATDMFVVMPNHFHAIAWIKPTLSETHDNGDTAKPGIPRIMRDFKAYSAKQINAERRSPGAPVWQKGYHDHVIRDESGLNRIREYIIYNPLRWSLDRENPAICGVNVDDTWMDKLAAKPLAANGNLKYHEDAIKKPTDLPVAGPYKT